MRYRIRISPSLIAGTYMALLLAVAAALLPGLAGTDGLAYTVVCLLLPAAIVYAFFRRPTPSFNVVLNLLLLFLAPLALERVVEGFGFGVAELISVALALPGFLLLDDSLKRYTAHRRVFTGARRERQVTPVFVSLAAAALAVMVIAAVVGRLVLLLAGIALLLYLVTAIVRVMVAVPRHPFITDSALKRVIAGTPGGMYLIISSYVSQPLYCRAAPADAWMHVRPAEFLLDRQGRARLELSFTPALAEESRPPLLISALDPLGLVQIKQRLEPLQLHVIPMARYAEWLARKYLEQVEAGIVAETRLPLERLQPKRGIEYQESRVYQPGDPMKDINWKHTMKLSQLIVDTYGETGHQAAIIATNLEASSPAEADRLAFDLITVALTLAQENIPAALTAYDRQQVALETGITDNLEVLKQALSLARQITTTDAAERHLEPTDIAKVRRNIRQLQQVESEPARRLVEILNFEHQAVEELAREHPAARALAAVTSRVPAPATIFLVSPLNHDAEAVLVATEKLARRKFSIVTVGNK
jgi:uncharacterized protein (DUF58 family)